MKSVQAECAKAIRKDLKEAFPDTKFSVRSTSASMMNAVDISWTDGPNSERVREIVDKYQHGHFDGMTDMYHYNSNGDESIPQVKYVQVHHKMSPELREELSTEIESEFGIARDDEDAWFNRMGFFHGFEGELSRRFTSVGAN